MRRPLRIVAGLTVAGFVYGWMVTQALRDLKDLAGRRLWPGPPIDYP